jgi:transcriptional regulator with XRE-family HTH domain
MVKMPKGTRQCVYENRANHSKYKERKEFNAGRACIPCGTDAANLSRIERGKQNPTPEVLEK